MYDYTLHCEGYMDAFHYNSNEHHYCFTTAAPDTLLKKGDSVILWVERAENPDLQASSNNKVWDIGYKGKRLLDLDCRNRKAEAQSEQYRNMVAIALASMLVMFAFYRVKHAKNSVV